MESLYGLVLYGRSFILYSVLFAMVTYLELVGTFSLTQTCTPTARYALYDSSPLSGTEEQGVQMGYVGLLGDHKLQDPAADPDVVVKVSYPARPFLSLSLASTAP